MFIFIIIFTCILLDYFVDSNFSYSFFICVFKNLFQVKAFTLNNDEQQQKQNDIMFMLSGDGINDDEPEKSKFAINAFTGELFLIASIDRDAPNGMLIVL